MSFKTFLQSLPSQYVLIRHGIREHGSFKIAAAFCHYQRILRANPLGLDDIQLRREHAANCISIYLHYDRIPR